MEARRALLVCMILMFVSFAGLSASEGADYDSPDTAYDLSGKVGIDPSLFHIRDMVYDGERHDLYMSTWETHFCGLFLLMRYNIDDDAVDNNLTGGWGGCQNYPNVWNIMSLTLDTDTNTVFGGARGSWWGGLQSYSIDTNTYNRAITPFLTWGLFASVAYDSAGKDVYAASHAWDGPGGDFFRYHVPTGEAINLTYQLSALWGPNSWGYTDLHAISYDSVNQIIYVGGVRGKLARYNTPLYISGTHGAYPEPDTAYQISLESTSWGLDTLSAMVYVPSTGSLYLGGSGGKFAVLTEDGAGGISVTDLTSAVSGALGGNYINDLAYGGGEVFIGASSGKFVKYSIATGAAIDLSGRIASFWGAGDVLALAYDTADDAVYIGGIFGRLARYNPVTVIPATIDVAPGTLNKKSRSGDNAVTAYIEIPGQDVGAVDIATVVLSTAKGSVHAQMSPSSAGDYDGDGIADLMVKFNRQAVIGIADSGDAVELTLSGMVGGAKFSGADLIRVIE